MKWQVKEYLEPQEIEKNKEVFTPWAIRGQPWGYTDYRTVREYISTVLSHSICGHIL